MIWVTDLRWSQIRGRFTAEEKAALQAAKHGETICPAGVTVDESTLSEDLATKLRDSVLGRLGTNKESPHA